MQNSWQHITGLLAFFALWDFPLTAEEVGRFFPQERISSDDLKKRYPHFKKNNNTYFSTKLDAQHLWKRRREGEKYSVSILQRVQKFARILRFFPFVRAIALSNTPAMNMAKDTSDIDLFIITKKGQVWTTRFYITLFFAACGLRAGKGKTKGKFCLSFFADEETADFSHLKKKNDIYLALWIATLKPLSGHAHIFQIQKENTNWMQQEFGITPLFSTSQQKKEKRSFWQMTFEIKAFFFAPLCKFFLQKKAKKFQQKDSSHYAPDMIFSDTMQKLHNPDRREEIRERWEREMKKFTADKSVSNQ